MKQLQRMLCLASALSVVAPVYASSAQTRIIGGTAATEGDWPWIVSVEYASTASTDPYNSHFCGGSLIASNWVLTAAHCAEDQTASGIVVRVGAYDLSSTATAGTLSAVDRILIHPGYDSSTYDNDLALLHLKTSMSSETLAPIGYSSMSSLAAGTSLTVMGWGATIENSPYNYPSVLRQVTIPLISDSTCASAYPDAITGNMVCAGEMSGGKDSCYGDSGGPLIYGSDASSAQQVGVVSWGDGCAEANKPGVYTRVANYIDWLTQHQSHLSMDTHTDLGYFPVNYAGSGTVNVVNNSSSTATLSSPTMASNSVFTVSSNGCSSVAAGESCTVGVTVNSASTGAQTDTLTATDTTSSFELASDLTATFLPQTSFSTSISDTTLSWFTGGSAAWTDGSSSLVAGSGLTSGTAVLQTEITGPATVSFAWSVKNPTSYSVLDYRVDGVTQAQTTSSTTATESVTLASGTHLLEWRLTKSSGASSRSQAVLSELTVTASGSGSTDSGSTSTKSSGGGSVGGLGLGLLAVGALWRRRVGKRA